MIIAGIMSGTSADGMDVALVQIRARKQDHPKLQLLAHQAVPFPAPLRKAILAAMNAQSTSTAELARLNWCLGLAYAEAVRLTLKQHPMKLDLIGCHGQTLYHQAIPQRYAGKKFACTWQAGEAALLAAGLGVPVVSNFRPADMAAGGQGAPLVPLLDFTLFRHRTRGRVLQNIGGIANMTAIPAGAEAADCIAFDCGPGNMVIDALVQQLYGQQFDRDGSIASKGKILSAVVQKSLRHVFYRKQPPKTAGREEFGREYAEKFLTECRKISSRNQDAVATATALTSTAIAMNYKQFCMDRMNSAKVDYIVSGGGARNTTLMHQLAANLGPLGCAVKASDEFGLPAEAKEAAAFALLAWQTWHHRPGNLPAATGAGRPAILGQVTYV